MKSNIKIIIVMTIAILICGALFIGLGSAFMPLLIAFGLAYLNFPLIKALEKRKVRRTYAVVAVFFCVAMGFILAFGLILPGLVEDSLQFMRELPQIYARAISKIELLLVRFGFDVEIHRTDLQTYLTEHASEYSGGLLKTSTNFLKGFFSNIFKILLFVLNLFLIPIFFFHLVNRYESISKEFKDLIPIPWRGKVGEYRKLCNTVLSGYIRGQVLVSFILAVLYSVGFWIIGLRFGFLIGISTGFLNMIPYVGSILGFCTAITIALANFNGMGPVMGVLVLFAIVQGLEGTIITPKLVGNKVGLGVLSTMLALIIGGNLLGFTGMLLAIPFAGILKVILNDLRSEYQRSTFFSGDKP